MLLTEKELRDQGLTENPRTVFLRKIGVEQPRCPKCGKSDSMFFNDKEWVCHHTHMIDDNPNAWVAYQPDRQRDKQVYDVRLRDGTIVKGCYPNAESWNPIFQHIWTAPKGEGKRPIADYRVTEIRRSHPDPFAE